MSAFNRFLDWFSNFFAHRKGLLPLVGMVLVLLNFLFRLIAPGWLTATDLFLHLGIVIAILGFMIAWAL
ncbi:MAG TPA: hypothetical protein PJ988_14990 [Anaerolinea sp.]|nr:hypothetical protein [Anaerolinea sp.]